MSAETFIAAAKAEGYAEEEVRRFLASQKSRGPETFRQRLARIGPRAYAREQGAQGLPWDEVERDLRGANVKQKATYDRAREDWHKAVTARGETLYGKGFWGRARRMGAAAGIAWANIQRDPFGLIEGMWKPIPPETGTAGKIAGGLLEQGVAAVALGGAPEVIAGWRGLSAAIEPRAISAASRLLGKGPVGALRNVTRGAVETGLGQAVPGAVFGEAATLGRAAGEGRLPTAQEAIEGPVAGAILGFGLGATARLGGEVLMRTKKRLARDFGIEDKVSAAAVRPTEPPSPRPAAAVPDRIAEKVVPKETLPAPTPESPRGRIAAEAKAKPPAKPPAVTKAAWEAGPHPLTPEARTRFENLSPQQKAVTAEKVRANTLLSAEEKAERLAVLEPAVSEVTGEMIAAPTPLPPDLVAEFGPKAEAAVTQAAPGAPQVAPTPIGAAVPDPILVRRNALSRLHEALSNSSRYGNSRKPFAPLLERVAKQFESEGFQDEANVVRDAGRILSAGRAKSTGAAQVTVARMYAEAAAAGPGVPGPVGEPAPMPAQAEAAPAATRPAYGLKGEFVDKLESDLYDLLPKKTGAEGIGLADLAAKTNQSDSAVAHRLLLLELKGRARRLPGNRFVGFRPKLPAEPAPMLAQAEAAVTKAAPEPTPPAKPGEVVAPTEPAAAQTTIFTEDKAQAARSYFATKRGQTGSIRIGKGPTRLDREAGLVEDLRQAVNLGGYHFERGARTFAGWSKQMVADVGEWVRPYLGQLWDRVTGRSIADKYAGSINLERLNTGEEVKAVYLDALNRTEAEVATLRRGKVSWGKTQAEADALQLSDADLGNLSRAFGTEPAKRKALRDLTQGRAEAVAQAMGQYRRTGNADDLLAAMQRWAEFDAPFVVAEQAATEAGRTLNTYKMLARARATADVTVKQQAIETAQRALAGRPLTAEHMAALAAIPEGDVQGYYNFLRLLKKVNPEDKALYLFQSSILSGVPTHLRNMLWNINRTLTETPVRALRGVVDIGVSRLQGRRRVYYPEEAAAIVGEVGGLIRGARKAIEVFRAGVTPEAAAKFDYVRWEPRGGIKNPVTWPFRALGAADAGARVVMSEGSLLEQGIRQARQEGLQRSAAFARASKLVQAPTIEMVRVAQAHADSLAMTGEMSPALRTLLRLREDLPRPFRFLANVVQPFVNVPWKLTWQVLDHSPLAFARLLSKEVRRSPEASDWIARGSLGSAVMGALAAADALGWTEITGGPPRGSAARDEFYRTKKVAYSVRIAGHRVSYRNFGPYALAFAAVAAAKDAVRRDPQADLFDRGAAAAMAIGNYMADASFLSGLSSLLDLLGPDADPKQWKAWLARTAKGFAWPSGAERTASRILDPYIRDPQTFYERLITDIPGISRAVPPRLDVFGRPVRREGGSGLRGLLPEQIPSAEVDRVDAELARLNVTVGPAAKSLRIGNAERSLTRGEWRSYQKLIGETMYESVKAFIGLPGYEELPDELRESVLTDEKDTARRAATDAFRLKLERAGKP